MSSSESRPDVSAAAASFADVTSTVNERRRVSPGGMMPNSGEMCSHGLCVSVCERRGREAGREGARGGEGERDKAEDEADAKRECEKNGGGSIVKQSEARK